MPRINPEGQLTRAERLATVIAIAGAVLVHLVVILGWGRLSRWTQEEEKKERLMVIRRVRDLAPPPETVPAQPRQRLAPAGEAGMAPAGKKTSPPPPPPSAQQVKEEGPEPPPEPELSPAMEQDLQQQKTEQEKGAEYGDNSVTVVTDLPAASFIVEGPIQLRGSGTYWVRKGAPPGVYVATFNPVAGFSTPPAQSKELVAKGQIVFVGKYRRSTEVVIESNVPSAQVTVYRPDNRPIDLSRPGRTFIDDLPLGTYTAVFKDLPPLITPAPVTQALGAGGKLSFYGEYRDAAGGGGRGLGAAGDGTGRGAPGSGSGTGGTGGGSGSGTGGRGAGRGGGGAGSGEGGLDRRVQMVVKSYPPTAIEEGWQPIPYPEVVIRRSNFQQGWCQVYLVIEVDGDGGIERILVERPQPESRARFEALIQTVERAVRGWDYDRVTAEVHVDVRFYVE